MDDMTHQTAAPQADAAGAAGAPGRKLDWKSELQTLLTIFVMVTVQCVAINGLYKPNGLISGGLTGVGMLLEYLSGFPSWLSILLLNIPLLALAV